MSKMVMLRKKTTSIHGKALAFILNFMFNFVLQVNAGKYEDAVSIFNEVMLVHFLLFASSTLQYPL